MTEKRILIVDDEVLQRIDENRGDLSRSDFIKFVINNQLGETEGNNSTSSTQYVSREEFQEFAGGMKDLMRRFLDFFISYGLELGQEPKDATFSELVQKLQALSANGGKPKAIK